MLRILVIKLDAIGDVVLVTPFLHSLRRNYAEAFISLVVSPMLYPLMVNCPYVNEVKTYQRLKYESGMIGAIKGYVRLIKWAKSELSKKYDIAIVPRWAPDFYHAGPLAWLSGAKRRISFSESCSKGSTVRLFRDWFYNELIYRTKSLHERDINLELIEYLKGEIETRALELWPSSADHEAVNGILGTIRKRYICISPGSMLRKKEWSEDAYLEIVRYLVDKNESVVLIGGPAEEMLGDRIAQNIGLGCINLAGKTSLNETATLLDKSCLFIGNDTGAMHIAVAMKTPVVMISCFPKDGDPLDLNAPIRFGPCPEVSSVVLQPEEALPPCEKQCFSEVAHCINQVTVEEVKKAISQLLDAK